MVVRLLSLCLVLCGLWLWCVPVTIGADAMINVYQVEGVINPVVVEYMTDSIRRAEEAKDVAVIFQLDTPGGLVDSTREIVKALLNANVPTVVYVAPSGALRRHLHYHGCACRGHGAGDEYWRGPPGVWGGQGH
jgi:membrane-bound serine protease (ClpP class)